MRYGMEDFQILSRLHLKYSLVHHKSIQAASVFKGNYARTVKLIERNCIHLQFCGGNNQTNGVWTNNSATKHHKM